MKRMQLNNEEVKVIEDYREARRVEIYHARIAEERANCLHNYEHDFTNYKTSYYKCTKCGLTEAR